MLNLLKKVALVCVSSFLVAVSFPPLGWWPCVLVAWLPLLLVVTHGSTREAFYLGLLQGMAAYGISLYWFFYIFGPAAVPLLAILAIFVALFSLVLRWAAQRIQNPFSKALFAACLWTAIEFYRSELFFLRFAWITPGMAIGPVWLTPVVGVYGVSFCVFLVSALLACRQTRLAGSIVCVFMLALGWLRPPTVKAGTDVIKVAAVQTEECTLLQCLTMTRAITNEKPHLVVWPEYSVPCDLRRTNPDALANIQRLARNMEALIVLGTETDAGPGRNGFYNTALVLDGSGVLGEYYKNRPVHFFKDGIPGKSVAPIDTPLGKIGTPICFDFDYTAVMRRMTAKGAELFAIPSFDSVEWSRVQHLQHSAMLKVRAAENARWIVCAASSGISQIVDPHGQIHSSLGPMKEGIVTGEVVRRKDMTFYTRIGWLFPWVCVILSCVCLCLCGGVIRNRKPEGERQWKR